MTLLSAKADVNLTDSRDMTALMMAGTPRQARLRLEHAARFACAAYSPPCFACNLNPPPPPPASAGQNRMLEMLLRHDATSVNTRDLNGWSVLHWAVAVNAIDCVRQLLATPLVDAYALTRHNESAFHLAARRGSLPVLQLLVNHYVNPPVKNATLATRPSMETLLLGVSHYGHSAMDLAQQDGDEAVVHYLQFVLNADGEWVELPCPSPPVLFFFGCFSRLSASPHPALHYDSRRRGRDTRVRLCPRGAVAVAAVVVLLDDTGRLWH